ncbi:hypothetical protein Tco_0523318 [Tanacetum coccineum]
MNGEISYGDRLRMILGIFWCEEEMISRSFNGDGEGFMVVGSYSEEEREEDTDFLCVQIELNHELRDSMELLRAYRYSSLTFDRSRSLLYAPLLSSLDQLQSFANHYGPLDQMNSHGLPACHPCGLLERAFFESTSSAKSKITCASLPANVAFP